MQGKTTSNRPIAENGCATQLPLVVLNLMSFGVTFYIGGRIVLSLLYEESHYLLMFALPGLILAVIVGIITLSVTRKRTPSFRVRAAVVSGAVVGAIPAILVWAGSLL